jgi:hypothetical protein
MVAIGGYLALLLQKLTSEGLLSYTDINQTNNLSLSKSNSVVFCQTPLDDRWNLIDTNLWTNQPCCFQLQTNHAMFTFKNDRSCRVCFQS